MLFVEGQQRFRVETGPDGTFDGEVLPGSFIVEVKALFDNQWRLAGWYDGVGITTDRTRAAEVKVDDRDVEGLEIMISGVIKDTDVEGIEIVMPMETARTRISGVVTDADGRPLEQTWLAVTQGDDWLADDITGADGAFDMEVSTGRFTLRVLVQREDSRWRTVGWYDGAGGITTIPGRVFEFIVEDTDIEGLEITIAAYLLVND